MNNMNNLTYKMDSLQEILSLIRHRGDKAIICDQSGSLTHAGSVASKYFDPETDVMLGVVPLHNASPWDIWQDTRGEHQVDAVSNALIPFDEEVDPTFFWAQASKVIFGAVIQKMYSEDDRSVRKLFDILEKPRHLLAYLKDSPHSFEERLLLSAQPILSEHLEPVYLHETLSCATGACQETKPTAVSIREWVLDEKNNGWCFLTSPNEVSTRQRLLLTWLSIGLTSSLERTVGSDQALWVIVDDLTMIGKPECLSDFIASARAHNIHYLFGYSDTPAKHSIAQARPHQPSEKEV